MVRTISLAILLALALSFGYASGLHQAKAENRSTPVAASATAANDQTTPDGGPVNAELQSADPNLVTTNAPFNPDFIKTRVSEQQVVANEIPVNGKLSLDAQEIRLSSARVAGRLGRIFVFEGQSVREGEALAEIYSADFISAENEYLLSQKFRNAIGKNPASADAELRGDAQATYESSANRLKVLGASDADIADLARRGTALEYLKIRAPITGVVTKRNVDPGGFLNVGDTLMTLANVDRLWLLANTYEADYAALRLGENLQFHTAALPDHDFNGTITFIAPSVDPSTHTLAIRCEVPNPEGLLRPEMFISGDLEIGRRIGTVIPKQAVVLVKDADYLFVKVDPQHYRRLAVKGYAHGADEYVVTDGLAPSQPVVIDGAVLLNQLLSSS